MSNKYNIDYHKRAFNRRCLLLNGYVKHIIVSFIDDYKNVRKNRSILNLKCFSELDYREIGVSFSSIANKYNMTIQTCFEERNLSEFGFTKNECLSHELAFKLTGKSYKSWRARGCGCVEMVDIGVYNSCINFCKYCYANYDEVKVEDNFRDHDPNSTLLIGKLENDDIIKIRGT